MDERWVKCSDYLPGEEGWYLVWAPGYKSWSSSGRENINGYMFVKFRPNYKIPWAIDVHCSPGESYVEMWMPLPEVETKVEEW